MIGYLVEMDVEMTDYWVSSNSKQTFTTTTTLSQILKQLNTKQNQTFEPVADKK